MELFFGQRIEELEEKSVSLPKIDEEEKCQPVDEKEEFDVVSQADDASQEEDIEEESIPEEDEENTPHVAGIDDAAMGEVSSGRQHLRWKKDIELEEYGRFVLGSADVDQPTQDAQCVSYVSTGPIYAWWPHALKRVMTQSATTIYNEVPCCTIDSDRCYQYCSSVP